MKRVSDDGAGTGLGFGFARQAKRQQADRGQGTSLAGEYDRHFAALNANFLKWMGDMVASGEDGASWEDAVRDYVAYAHQLQERYQADNGQVYTWGTGDCGQLGNGVEEGASVDTYVGEKPTRAVRGKREGLLFSAPPPPPRFCFCLP